MKGTKEFYEVMEQFEKEAGKWGILPAGQSIERAKRDEQQPGQFYKAHFVNVIFTAYLAGYQHHKATTNQ